MSWSRGSPGLLAEAGRTTGRALSVAVGGGMVTPLTLELHNNVIHPIPLVLCCLYINHSQLKSSISMQHL